MDAITRMLANVSPGWALRRATARAKYDMLATRTYEAARSSRATSGWQRPSTSPNVEIYGGLVGLRNGSREMVRNNPLAGRALRIMANNVVATGIEIEPRTDDKKTNKELKALHTDHSAACDYTGQLSRGGLQYMSVRSMLEGGETLVRRIIVSDKKLPVPLQYQLLEGDYLDHRQNGIVEGKKTYQGVAVGEKGKRVGYWLFGEHPGEQLFMRAGSIASTFVAADDILHLYELLRLGQMRGVPWLTAGMLKARDLDGYEESELVRKRIEACVAAIIIGVDQNLPPDQKGITPMVKDSAGNVIESFSPGMIAIAAGGKDIKFTSPTPIGGYGEYKSSVAHDLSSAWNVTFEQLTGDLSQTNFTGFKAGLNEFRRTVEVLQWIFAIPMLVTPMYRDFVDMAIVRGRIKVTADNAASLYAHDVTAPKVGSVDSLNDARTDIAEVRAFLKSPQEAIRARGYDPDSVLEQHAEWHNKLAKAKVVSDADPALAPAAGAAAGKKEGGGVETPATDVADDDVSAPSRAADDPLDATARLTRSNGHANGHA